MTNTNTLPFTWVPGMLLLDAYDDSAVVIDHEHATFKSAGTYRISDLTRPRPDTEHAGTAALLLDQLRARVGEQVGITQFGSRFETHTVSGHVLAKGVTRWEALYLALKATAPSDDPKPAKPRAVPTASDFEAVAAALDKHVGVIMKVRQRLTASGLVALGMTADDFLDALPGMIDFLLASHRKLAAVEAALEAEEVTP